MTKADWKVVEERLKALYLPVMLQCDGYEVTLCLERAGIYRNVITVYVNGKWEGRWFADRTEELKFFPPRKRHLFPAKEREKFARRFGKRAAKDSVLFKTVDYHGVVWNSFGALRRHLRANCQSIVLVKEEATDAA